MPKGKLLKIIEEYLAVLKNNGFEISDAYLFGSYAKNKANSDSDIDIAVILKNIDDYFDTQLEMMKLRRNVNLYIEPHPISKKDFRNHILFDEIKNYGLKVL